MSALSSLSILRRPRSDDEDDYLGLPNVYDRMRVARQQAIRLKLMASHFALTLTAEYPGKRCPNDIHELIMTKKRGRTFLSTETLAQNHIHFLSLESFPHEQQAKRFLPSVMLRINANLERLLDRPESRAHGDVEALKRAVERYQADYRFAMETYKMISNARRTAPRTRVPTPYRARDVLDRLCLLAVVIAITIVVYNVLVF